MIIAVDFDGTIVEHEYPKMGKEIPFAIDSLKKLQEEDQHMLILWTVRDGELLEEAVQFCEKRGLKFYAVNKNYPEEDSSTASRKINADLYLDDRGLGGLPDWGMIYKMIKSGPKFTFNYNILCHYEMEVKKSDRKNFFTKLGEVMDKGRSKR
ncbi:MAG: hypothetical protein LBM08_04080 [Dysgonamonadaceae bacterium]|jgi:hypothetical protein|nr:hypothetical protein [Dysgonamonadaceae bacterium]